MFWAPSHTGTMGPLGGSTDALAPNHTGLVASPAGLKNVRLFKQPPTSFPPPAMSIRKARARKPQKCQNRGYLEGAIAMLDTGVKVGRPVWCPCISEMLRGPVELLLRSRFRAQFSCAPLSLRFILPTTTRIPGSQIAPLSVSLLLCFYPLSLPPACSLLHFKRPVSSSSLHFSIFFPFSPFSFFPSRAASPELQGIRKGNKGFA